MDIRTFAYYLIISTLQKNPIKLKDIFDFILPLIFLSSQSIIITFYQVSSNHFIICLDQQNYSFIYFLVTSSKSDLSYPKIQDNHLFLMKNNTQKLTLHQWQTNLTSLKQKFDFIKKKNSSITNRQSIQKLNNQHVKADHVLLREFLQNYSKPQQLKNQATFSQVKSCFELLKSKYQQVQEHYLKHNNEGKHDQEKSNADGNPQQTTKEFEIFEQNKIKLSKFIKDEPEVYKKSLENSLQKVKGIEDESGIPAHNISQFLKSLLNQNKHIKVYLDKDLYFSQANYKEQVLQIVKKYTIQVKQLPENSFSLDQIYITQEEILQFLTFWLQSSIEQSRIFIIYARTEKILSKLQQDYLKYIPQEKMSTQKVINNQLKNDLLQSKTLLDQQQSSDITHKIQQNLKSKILTEEPQQQLPYKSILKRYRQRTPTEQQNSRLLNNSLSKSLTKQDKLQRIIPQLFTFACKRRTRIHKGTTFDQIQGESKFMDLEKFINFCNYLQINDLISRQLLIDEFKLHAINRLTLNVQKFGLVMKKLTEKNSQVTNKLLSLQKLTFLKKKDKMKKIIENHGKSLSKYNYELRPVNGKDIESIQVELQEKKKIKELIKKEKQDILLRKKQGLFAKYHSVLENKGTRQKIVPIHDSNLSFRDLNQNSKKQIKRNQRNFSEKFNPASLISYEEQNDKLWDEYESRIWKKDNNKSIFGFNQQFERNSSHNDSILQQALQKRIQKGNKVLKKINSSNLKFYI